MTLLVSPTLSVCFKLNDDYLAGQSVRIGEPFKGIILSHKTTETLQASLSAAASVHVSCMLAASVPVSQSGCRMMTTMMWL